MRSPILRVFTASLWANGCLQLKEEARRKKEEGITNKILVLSLKLSQKKDVF
jgi:hypothetical protein